jgi:hypothetical protein
MDLVPEGITNDMRTPCAEPVWHGHIYDRCGKASRFLVVNPADQTGQRVCGQHVGAAIKSASRGGDVIVRADHPDEYAR